MNLGMIGEEGERKRARTSLPLNMPFELFNNLWARRMKAESLHFISDLGDVTRTTFIR